MSPRLQLIALSVLVAFGAMAAYIIWAIPISGEHGDRTVHGDDVVKSLGKPMDERFRLVDHLGRQVGPDTFSGKARLVFFGFTNCPEVCLTGLTLMSQLLKELGPDAKDVQALFVSVDPERDTVAVLSEYISAFAGDILGLTGTPAQVEEAAKAFNVYFKKVPQPSGGYTVDHTAVVYLLDPDGNFRAAIDIHERQEVALQKIRRALAPRN